MTNHANVLGNAILPTINMQKALTYDKDTIPSQIFSGASFRSTGS